MKKARISIVAAIDEKRGIGKKGGLLFKIPEDFERMRSLARGRPVIMGRKTFEAIGRVLPYPKLNIIISRSPDFKIAGAAVVHSLQEALVLAGKMEEEEIIIFGGGQIFTEALPLVDRLYLTVVEGDFGADTFFPDYSEFKKVIFEESHQSDGYKYKFLDLERDNNL